MFKLAQEIAINDLIVFGGLTYQVNDIAENDIGDMILSLLIPKPIDLEELGVRIIVLIPKHIKVNLVGSRS